MYVVLLIFRFFDDQPFLLEADFFIYLTILMLRRNIPAMGGNTMPAMPWLLKSPEHQQAWYWLCRKDNMYCCSRFYFIYLCQAKSKIDSRRVYSFCNI